MMRRNSVGLPRMTFERLANSVEATWEPRGAPASTVGTAGGADCIFGVSAQTSGQFRIGWLESSQAAGMRSGWCSPALRWISEMAPRIITAPTI